MIEKTIKFLGVCALMLTIIPFAACYLMVTENVMITVVLLFAHAILCDLIVRSCI